MIAMTAGEIAAIVGGELHLLDSALVIDQRPVIDSRLVDPTTFFVAFTGEHLDGHQFVADAIAAGAPFALTSRTVDFPSIRVADVQRALGALANALRHKLPRLKVAAITGSQGKTTTKDLLAHVLKSAGEVVAPAGSLNNEIGVPLTLLRCTESTDFCILEMGARHIGDIARLMEIAEPDVGSVLVVGSAHIGEFGGREAIALAKSEMITSLPEGGIAVLGTYDPYTPHMADGLELTTITFGERSDCDVRAADIEFREGRAHFDLVTSEGRSSVGLELVGAHQVPNALAAAAIATALGLTLESIAASLSTATLASKWRMEMHEYQGLLLINDAYNANPESMSAALRTLALLAQERGGATWAFLGKMHELGESSPQEHAGIGRLARDIGIDHLIAVAAPEYLGDLATDGSDGDTNFAMVQHVSDDLAGAGELARHFCAGDVVLVKASRSERFEELAELLMSTWREVAASADEGE
jgi:UDP-N-acetylmuramoyl-tripeptide--D-alanyl-D-alanine ligase